MMVDHKKLTEFKPSEPLVLSGEQLLSPEDVCLMVSAAMGGATFTIKQVARLGNMKLLRPVLFKRRRLYRRKDVEALLRSGSLVLSPSDPTMARLARPERRARQQREARAKSRSNPSTM